MVVTCDIEFENSPEAIYYGGQVVLGKVTLTADKVKQYKAVNLKINGSAKTRWRQHRVGKRSDRTCHGQIDYIKTVTCLLAPKATDQAVVIEPGIHTFSFACHLPLNCPSSFEGLHGSIKYVVEVSLERPWKFDHTFLKGFTVLTPADLNNDIPILKLPSKFGIAKTFCCGPCKTDVMELDVQLPQTGYVPGQLIPINVLVTNNTMSKVNQICARLVMLVTYFSTNRTDSINETKTISTLIGDPVLRNCRKVFNYLLPVPATPPTCLTLCSIIQISYRVEVEAKIQCIYYRNPCVHTPVTIGNVPLQVEGMVVQTQPTQKQLQLENVRASESKNNSNNDAYISNENKDPWSALTNISPPVYKAAVHMPKGKLAENADQECGEQEFTPKYPVFDVPSPSTSLPPHGDEVDGRAAPASVADTSNTTWL